MAPGKDVGFRNWASEDGASIPQYYREQAARLARLAERSKFGDVREQLIQIARQYEALARRAVRRRPFPAILDRRPQY